MTMVKHRPMRSVHEKGQTGRISSWLLFLMALSFAAQPTMYRPMGLPLALGLVATFNLSWLFLEFRVKPDRFLILMIFPSFLVLTDLLIGTGYRGFILAMLLVFAYIGSALRLSEKDLIRIWAALAWVGFFLAMLGSYRYVNGYVAPFSENTEGISELSLSYFYLGIGYLPATRNSDAFYFAVGLLAALRLASSADRLRLLYLLMAFAQASAVALTLSRGAYIAVLIAAYLMLEARQKRRGFVALGLLVLISSVTLFALPELLPEQMLFIFFLIKNSMISLFDVNSANQTVDGFYTYSNNGRLDLYLGSLKQFFAWPLGQGVDNTYFGNANRETTRLHSENLFLDLLIIFGVFSAVLFLYAAKPYVRAIRFYKTSLNARAGISALSLCLVFALFNSPVNLVIFWFMIALGFAEANRAAKTARDQNTAGVSL
jgi:hypothetical protein